MPSRLFTFILLFWGLLLFSSCSRQGVIVSADRERLSDMEGCFQLLGTSVETGGPILKRLCTQDIERIISFSKLSEDHGAKVKELVCGPKATPEKFKTFFESLPTRERTRLIRSFEMFGYNINGYGC